MKVLLAHCDFAPASLALLNVKAYALADEELAPALSFRMVGGFPHEDPETWMERVLEAAKEFRPDVVGLSLYVWSRYRMYEVTRRIADELPEAKVVWGGPDVSDEGYATELLAEHPDLDVIVRDEGERSFRRLLRHWRGIGRELEEIPGISFRDEKGAAHGTGPVDFLEDLDEIPSLLDQREVQEVIDDIDVFALETFRGCYMGCAYCYWGGSRRRAYSQERVYSDLGRILKQRNIKKIWFFDSMFGFKKKVGKELLRFIVKHKAPDQNVTFFPNLDFIDEEMCLLMKEAGVYIEAGIQTTNERAYEYLNRKWDKKFLDSKIPLLEKYGLKSNAQQLILGLPGDDIEGFRGSVDYAFHTQPESIQIFPFSVLPATGYWKRMEEFQVRHEGEYRIVYSSTTFSEEDTLIGGLIMAGAKWFEHHPGLALRLVDLLGVRPSELFEAIGRVFQEDVMRIPDTAEERPRLRRALLTQAFSLEDLEKLKSLEFLRHVLSKCYGHLGLEGRWQTLLEHDATLNCVELLDGDALSDEEMEAASSAWKAHPQRVGPIEAPFNVFDAKRWQERGGFRERIVYYAHPLETPKDFFGKDLPRYRVIVRARNGERVPALTGDGEAVRGS